jgi:hypothetical protein
MNFQSLAATRRPWSLSALTFETSSYESNFVTPDDVAEARTQENQFPDATAEGTPYADGESCSRAFKNSVSTSESASSQPLLRAP